MERCDLSFILRQIQEHLCADRLMSQSALLEVLFHSCYEEAEEPLVFDPSLVCRWYRGKSRISPKISSYYRTDFENQKLARDIGIHLFPALYDQPGLTQTVYEVFQNDPEISDVLKREVAEAYPCASVREEAFLIAVILKFCMMRGIAKQKKQKTIRICA